MLGNLLETGASTNPKIGRQPYVDLILMTSNDYSVFVVDATTTSFHCPRVLLSADLTSATTLGELIQHGARNQLGLDIKYIGVASIRITTVAYEMVAVAELSQPLEQQPQRRPGLRPVTLARLREDNRQIQHLNHFELARDRAIAEHSSITVGPLIQKAYNRSLDYLDEKKSSENNRVGWSQYLDQRTIGIVSTAQGILSHLYVGKQSPSLDEAIKTLVSMQNPDGGWQVRRALIGGSSDLSITESTCYVLMTLLQTGRSLADGAIAAGIQWLEQTQQKDGGWPSSTHASDPQICATALAVRALTLARRTDVAGRGANWLRRQQHEGGGWSQGQKQPGAEVSPGFSAHAIMALVEAGKYTTIDLTTEVQAGCRYLKETFDDKDAEPWKPIAVNTVVDSVKSVRLEFRFFSTALGLTALAMAGSDLSDRVALMGTRRLLELQDSNGGWRCSSNAHGTHPIWATHDALLALKSVTGATVEKITVIAKSPHEAREREILHAAIMQSIVADNTHARHRRVRGWLQTSWLSALSIIVLLLIGSEFGLFDSLTSSSPVSKYASVGLTSFIALLGALIPAILAEEYKIRRERSRTKDAGR
jgi:hypothetical protein